MTKKDKNKSIIKDIAMLLSIWVPLLFVIIGGMIWMSDGFDGTIMEQLFPAIFCGFIAAVLIVISLSNICPNDLIVWIIAAIVLIATVIVYMLDLTDVLIGGAIILFGGAIVLILIKMIAGRKR